MAKAMAQQHSNQGSSVQVGSSNSASTGVSPSKLANLRSNYLQQMRDLHSLYENGAINESEFLEQKRPILEQLKALRPL